MIAWQYPLLCETYIETELTLLRERFDVKVFTERDPPSDHLKPDPCPHETHKDPEALLAALRAFDPQLLHGHWLTQWGRMERMSEALGVPYTIRAHSFDTIPTGYMAHWFNIARPFVQRMIVGNERFLGVLAFHFSRPIIERWGLRSDLITDAYPLVDVPLFRDRSPNGEGVVNTGACLPKKGIPQYLKLAELCPEVRFDYYPVGYATDEIIQANEASGGRVAIHDVVPHSEMPGVYKAHEWLVYTANFKLRNVGWSMSVAEAQASGCGVIYANVRPDLREFVGEAAYLYDHISEVPGIIRAGLPEEKRELGFELAERCDARSNLHQLTDLWEPYLGEPRPQAG